MNDNGKGYTITEIGTKAALEVLIEVVASDGKLLASGGRAEDKKALLEKLIAMRVNLLLASK